MKHIFGPHHRPFMVNRSWSLCWFIVGTEGGDSSFRKKKAASFSLSNHLGWRCALVSRAPSFWWSLSVMGAFSRLLVWRSFCHRAVGWSVPYIRVSLTFWSDKASFVLCACSNMRCFVAIQAVDHTTLPSLPLDTEKRQKWPALRWNEMRTKTRVERTHRDDALEFSLNWELQRSNCFRIGR